MKVRFITLAFSTLEVFLHLPLKYLSTYIYVSNKITFSLIHEMYIRSTYISYESTLSILVNARSIQKIKSASKTKKYTVVR